MNWFLIKVIFWVLISVGLIVKTFYLDKTSDWYNKIFLLVVLITFNLESWGGDLFVQYGWWNRNHLTFRAIDDLDIDHKQAISIALADQANAQLSYVPATSLGTFKQLGTHSMFVDQETGYVWIATLSHPRWQVFDFKCKPVNSLKGDEILVQQPTYLMDDDGTRWIRG